MKATLAVIASLVASSPALGSELRAVSELFDRACVRTYPDADSAIGKFRDAGFSDSEIRRDQGDRAHESKEDAFGWLGQRDELTGIVSRVAASNAERDNPVDVTCSVEFTHRQLNVDELDDFDATLLNVVRRHWSNALIEPLAVYPELRVYADQYNPGLLVHYVLGQNSTSLDENKVLVGLGEIDTEWLPGQNENQ